MDTMLYLDGQCPAHLFIQMFMSYFVVTCVPAYGLAVLGIGNPIWVLWPN